MAKSKVAATPANDDGCNDGGNDGCASYRINESVKIVNGVKVSGETVSLTKAQALHDLSLGRIEPVVAVPVVSVVPEVATDGGD
jgi:hypothetical protein